MSLKPRQVILVGNQPVSLPEGVTALDWALERVNAQNPRIRSFLGSIRLVEGVLESNYPPLPAGHRGSGMAPLHSHPARPVPRRAREWAPGQAVEARGARPAG